MKTSSFTIAGRNPRAVSIARSTPPWYTGPEYRLLAPPWSLIEDFKRGRIDWSVYAERYCDLTLCGLSAGEVYDKLLYLADGEPILLCWEKPGLPCHRRLVAVWLETALGITIPELTP